MPKTLLGPNCLFCEQFQFEEATGALSEVTPGSEMTMFCREGKWYWMNGDNQKRLTECMLKAIDCRDFRLSNLAKSMDIKMRKWA